MKNLMNLKILQCFDLLFCIDKGVIVKYISMYVYVYKYIESDNLN